MDLKILTFNIWDIPFWFSVKRHDRAHGLGPYLKKVNPDIICLQEAFDVKHRELIHKNLGEKDFNIIEDFERTRKVLFLKRFDLTGGLVTFSKFPMNGSAFTPFKKSLRMLPQERIGRKGFSKSVLETPFGPILMINVHFHAGRNNNAEKIRTKQLDGLLKNLEKATLPTIIAGDFNEDVRLAREPFFAKLKNAGFKDSAEISGQNRPATGNAPQNPYAGLWLYKRPDPYHLDYIFFRESGDVKIELKKYEVLERPALPLSDHEAVMATFSINKK